MCMYLLDPEIPMEHFGETKKHPGDFDICMFIFYQTKAASSVFIKIFTFEIHEKF